MAKKREHCDVCLRGAPLHAGWCPVGMAKADTTDCFAPGEAAPSEFADSAAAGKRCIYPECGGRVWGGACDLCGTPDVDADDDGPTDADLDAIEKECSAPPTPTPKDYYAGTSGAQSCPHPPEKFRYSNNSCDQCGRDGLPVPSCSCDSCSALRLGKAGERHAKLHQMWYRTMMRRGGSSYF